MTTCDKPTISAGSVSPVDTTVNYRATYEVTCDTGYTISRSSTMTCGADGTLDQTPMCLHGKINNNALQTDPKIKHDIKL